MQEINIKMKHLMGVFPLLGVKSALELMDYYVSCFESKTVLFKDLEWSMQQSLQTVQPHTDDEEITIPIYDEQKCYAFVESFLKVVGKTDDEIENIIISIPEMYKVASLIFGQINALQSIATTPADPNVTTTN